jgi:hypothetical protein
VFLQQLARVALAAGLLLQPVLAGPQRAQVLVARVARRLSRVESVETPELLARVVPVELLRSLAELVATRLELVQQVLALA